MLELSLCLYDVLKIRLQIAGIKCSLFAFFLLCEKKCAKFDRQHSGTMPSNKHASFRYLILNECFTTLGHSRWTKQELINRVSEKMQEAGLLSDKKISERTIADDIAHLRRHRQAPIVVKAGCYYYGDPAFNLEKTPLKPEEIKVLQEAFALLQQFPNLPHLDALEALLYKINRDPAHLDLSAQTIQLESNPEVKGLQWLSPLYQAIQQQQVLSIDYQGFNTPKEKIVFHPYLLKEWRNRWYVVGRHHEKQVAWNLALDRIQHIHPSLRPFLPNDLFDPLTYYSEVIGVTVNAGPAQEIVFRCNKKICGYLHTKPLHPSQLVVETAEAYEVFSIRVIPNQEALGELYRFGPDLEILNLLELSF